MCTQELQKDYFEEKKFCSRLQVQVISALLYVPGHDSVITELFRLQL